MADSANTDEIVITPEMVEAGASYLREQIKLAYPDDLPWLEATADHIVSEVLARTQRKNTCGLDIQGDSLSGFENRE